MPPTEPTATVPTGGLAMLDYVVLVVYLLAMLGMGITIALRQRSTEDFFIGGRNLPSWAVGISILASLLSTITYLGMPGEMFRTGVGFLTRQLGVPAVLAVIWLLWLPFYMRLNLTSAYEYLERRFDYRVRVMGAVLCLALLFGWMAVVVLTASQAMAEITYLNLPWFFGSNTSDHRDADMHAIILAIGLFSVLYTTLGGIRAVVWTDVIQFFILIGGAIFTIGFIAYETNSGLGAWISAQQGYAYRESVEWVSFDVGNRSTVLFISVGMFFWFVCTHGANQVALQRYFSVSSPWEAKKSYLVSAVSSFGLGLILAGVGLSLIYFVQAGHDLPASEGLVSADALTRNTAQDKVFPQFIRFYLPAGVRGLVVAALFAAAMSTIDSGANSVSTVVTVDFFRRLRGEAADSELRLARVLTATMGLIIVVITIALYHASKGTDIISLCQKGFNCFLGPLGAIFVLGMFSSRAVPQTVLPAVVVGEVFGLCASYSSELFGVSYSTHLVVPGSWLVTVVIAWLLSLVFQTRATDKQKLWMWVPVVYGQNSQSAAAESKQA